MKILLVSHIFPPAVDGGSKVIWKIGEYLHQHNHQVIALSSNCYSTDDFVNPKSVSLTSSIVFPIPLIRLPVHKNLRRILKAISLIFPPNSYPRHFLDIFQKGPVFKIIPFIKACYQIHSFKPDLIIAGPLPTSIIIYANFLKKLTGAKLLINASFHYNDSDFQKNPLLNILKASDYIWSLTDFEKSYFLKQLGVKKSHIQVLGNGVDASLIASSSLDLPKKPNLLFIGSFAKHKNIDLILKAFEKISVKVPECTLTLAGQKTLYWPILQKIIDDLPVSVRSKIVIKNNFSDQDLPSLIDSSTLLIQPSLQESFGLTIIESWARFRPVIASDIPSSQELICRSQGGLLFKHNEPDDLADKIVSLLGDPHQISKLAANGHQYLQNNFTWDKIGQRIETWITQK